jgi:hypothetical protein
MFRPSTSPRLVAVWLALAALLSVGMALRLPISVPEPVYFADAKAWSPSTPIADTFTPLAYPLFVAPVFRLAGTGGVLAVQAVLQLATVAVAFALLLLLDVSPRVAGLGALLILLHPEFLLSIPKIWDVGLSAFLFLLLVLVCLLVQRNGPAWGLCLAVGMAFGAALFCRPNFALLVPVVVAAFWRAPAKVFAVRIASAALIAALTFALAGIAAHGRPFWPRNGPYNLYAGDNPFSGQALLEKLNAEPSIYPAFRAQHPDLVPANPAKDFYYSPAFQHIFTHDALIFVVHHPGEQAQLVAIKLFTLFRPDTKVHPLRSASGLGKAVLALPALLFLVALFAPGRPPLTCADWLLIAFAAAYVLPFLLTNSDPRFRTPLDALLIVSTVSLLFHRYAAASTHGTA